MDKLRAFLAIPLPDPLLERAVALRDRLRQQLPGVRWVDGRNLHLTLRFFGQIGDQELEKITNIMLSIGTLSAPFPIEVAGVGAFPHRQRPRVVWLGVQGGEPLALLHQALERELVAAGFPAEERPFTPHLTLGRAKARVPGALDVLTRHRQTPVGTATVDRMTLFESRLQPGGAIHHPLKIVPLGTP